MSVIFITGAPGCGKSTVAAILHKKLKCPWFEFGWIPEFRNLNPQLALSYEEEERISYENLVLVTENYLRHGYEHVILTDLRYEFLDDLREHFGERLKVIILYCNSDEELCRRILTRDNGNEYRDTQAACQINAQIRESMHAVEAFQIQCDAMEADEEVERIMEELYLVDIMSGSKNI